MKFNGLLFFLCANFLSVNLLDPQKASAQEVLPGVADTIWQSYDFLDVRRNTIDVESVQNLYPFFEQLQLLIRHEDRQVKVVHIGDSHIQADYFSGGLRVLLQKSFGNAGRGFVFPYGVAGTNGPADYGVLSGGEWQRKKASAFGADGNSGLNAYGLHSDDSRAWLNVYPANEAMDYTFERVRLFTYDSPSSFDWQVYDSLNPLFTEADMHPAGEGQWLLQYQYPQDSFKWQLKQTDSSQYFAEFYGVSLEKNRPGILYHSAGQNGAFVQNFLNSPFFLSHLRSLEADLIILSLGTNNAYANRNRMCASCFKETYSKLLAAIREKAPEAAILLTTPGDFFIKRRYHCRDISKVVNAIKELSAEYDCAVWDFNVVMGGDYAIRKWQQAGLAQNDLIHFTKEGYQLQAYMLYEALTDAFQHWKTLP